MIGNAVGVRIYVDVVFNHMTGIGTIGSGGSTADPARRDYPAVPYRDEHFNRFCTITDFRDPVQLRNCELYGLPDLDQSNEHVRTMIVNYLNHLIDLGVAGDRIDRLLIIVRFIISIFDRFSCRHHEAHVRCDFFLMKIL